MWLLWESALDLQHEESNLSLMPAALAPPTDSGSSPDALVQATLYPYQQQGVGKLLALAEQGLGCLLADEMGLGKTIQAIALLAWLSSTDSGPSLVIAPSSTTTNWCRELSKFAPNLSVHEHTGSRRSGDPAFLQMFNVVVTSFDLAVRDQFLLQSVNWRALAVDEAQNVKNPRAQRSAAIRELRTDILLAITGTPIENSLTDLWSIMSLVAPSYLSSLEEFSAMYPDEEQAAAELGRRVAPLTIRRRVREVASDLPSRTDALVPVRPSPALVAEYERIRSDAALPLLAKFTYLRQACSSLSSVEGLSMPFTQHNPKYDHALQIITEAFALSCKVLLFASFTDTVDEIYSDLAGRFSRALVLKLDGRTPIQERQRLLDEFASFPGPAILILNPKAAGVGLNIQSANYVIHFTPEWNPATIDQASARSYRRGQTRPVFIYSLYYAGTVEENMLERVALKRQLAESGMSAAESTPSATELKQMVLISPNEMAI
ncbi:ATP-dependent helicase [Arthrobacter agilis]|uniref:ATP-dependent helicase n=1 Tax=Arthrobacter agilis TaxID=37921 RepID=A0A2L0UGQ5_9MICC|nr:ATP-dependent helicase [Arthrobacter agilis]